MRHTFSIADDGTTVKLSRGDSVTVVLGENPTTGYRWHCSVEPVGALSLEADEYESQGASPGAGGEHRFHFSATANGAFRMECRRSRGQDSVAGTFALDGTVT